MPRLRVYVAGPISQGDVQENVKIAIEVGRHLIDLGFAPLVPHLDYFMPNRDDISHEDWLEVDLPWLRVADAVLRIPGASVGADIEVKEAQKRNIPVFNSITTLVRQYGQQMKLEDE